MKRLLLIAVLGGVALIPVAAQAQRGGMGGHGGMGARGGAGARGGFAGHVGAARPAGMRVSPMRANTRISGRTFSPRNRFAFNRFDRDRFRHRRFFFNDCFNTFGAGFGCTGLYAGYPYYDPFFDYSSGYQQPQQQPVVEDSGGNDREVAFEVQALRDEIQSMRDEQRNRNAEKSAAAQPTPKDDSPNAILVFRDGIQLPIRNYAITGDTIWVLDKPNQKISMAKLDIPATRQVNEKNGFEFHLPQ